MKFRFISRQERFTAQVMVVQSGVSPERFSWRGSTGKIGHFHVLSFPSAILMNPD
jgi:hypothetical protein